MKQISNKFHRGALSVIYFLVSIETLKGWPSFFKFQSISVTLPSVATDNKETVSVPIE